MGVNWAQLITIFLAIVLAEIFCRGVLQGGSIGGTSTSVGVATHSPAEPTVIYSNPIEEYIAKHHPTAVR